MGRIVPVVSQDEDGIVLPETNGDTYNHPLGAFHLNHMGELKAGFTFDARGEDAYSLLGNRGDMLIIPFMSETSEDWAIAILFHKGQTTMVALLPDEGELSMELELLDRWKDWLESNRAK